MAMALKLDRRDGFARRASQPLASPLEVAQRLLMAHLAISADMARHGSADRRDGRNENGGKS